MTTLIHVVTISRRKVFVAALLLAGCGGASYLYRPTALVTATEAGRPASRHLIPPEAPRGEVIVSSSGLTELQVTPRRTARFVHARLVVSNHNAEGAWRLEPGRQLLVLPDGTQAPPTYVNSNVAPGPITVPPGQKVVVDLYYAAPPGYAREDRLPTFDLRWFVDTPAREVAERTVFERLEVVPAPPPAHVHGTLALGWGPIWWADPFWYHPRPYAWWGPRYVIVERPRVGPPPRRRVAAPPAPARPAEPEAPQR